MPFKFPFYNIPIIDLQMELSSANEPNGTLQSEEPMDANSNVLEEKEGNEEADGPTDGTTEEVADADDRPDFMNEEDSDEDDFVVTIGEIKANVPFQKQHSRTGGATSGTIDLDANPMLKDGTPIYDLDLATMEDKPWRKPGADITDYFNYGFNEETWNHYCERQRKFRQEFATDQAAINKAILSNIQIVGPPIGLTTFAGGRQLVNLAGGHVESKQQQNKVQKIVVDLSKPPPFVGHSTGNDFPQGNPIPLIRTVISESGIMTRRESTSDLVATYSMEDMDSILHDTKPSPEPSPLAKTPPISLANAAQNIGIIDFSKPPPTFDPAIPPPQTLPVSQIMAVPRSQPPPVQVQPAANTTTASMPMAKPTKLAMPTNFDLPPGVEEADGPPGVGALEMPPALPIPRIDFSQPPPTSQFSYNPNPSFGGQPSSTFNAPGLHLQQPFSGGHTRPSPLFQPSFRHPFGSSFGAGRFHDRFKPNRGMSRVEDRSRSPADSDSESGPSHRKRHRSRSRSRSPSPSRRRHKEEKEKHKDRGERKEKDGKKKKEKDKDRDKRSKSVKKDRERESRSIKQERRSSEREKEEKESTSRRRSPETSKRREKEGSEKNLIKIKIERKSPGWD